MSQNERIRFALRNSAVGLCCYGLTAVAHLLVRRVFASCLPVEYLGALKIFSDVLGLLSFVDMGLYAVFAQALYRPVAEEDEAAERDYLAYFRRAFRLVALAVLLLGAAASLLLPVLFPALSEIPGAQAALLFQVVATATPYLTMEVQSLMLARQHIRVAQGLLCLANLLTAGAQILLLRGGYGLVAYCIASAAGAVLFTLSLLPFAGWRRGPVASPLPQEQRRVLRRNILAGSCHKLGGVVYSFTDSFIITWISGFAATGCYDSFTALFIAVSRLVAKLLEGFVGAIGSLCSTESREKSFLFFGTFCRAAAVMAGFASGMLFCLAVPFVRLWLGPGYALPRAVVLALAVQYYIQIARMPILYFKDAYGLWWQDRWKPLAEAAVNLALSVLLARRFGILGVVLGTILSLLFVAIATETVVLSRHGFGVPPQKLLLPGALHALSAIVAGAAGFYLGGFIPAAGWGGLALRALATAAVLLLILGLWHGFTGEARIIYSQIKRGFGPQKEKEE